MNRALRNSLIAIGVAAVALAGVGVWRSLPQRQRVFTDADTIHTPAESAPLRDVLWQPPVALPPAINTTDNDYEPCISPDGLTVYFVRGKPGGGADLFVTRMTADGWSEPAPIEGVNSKHDDLGPAISADGTQLYFYSDRPGGAGGYDLWVARRRNDGDVFGPPTNLGALVNSALNDYGPALSPDGSTLYFASNRPQPKDPAPLPPGAWPATVREQIYARDYDLYTAPVTEAGVGTAKPLVALNSPGNDGSPAFSPVGDFLYFSTDRADGAGGFDLMRSRLVRGQWQSPEFLGDPVNTPANELDPTVGPTGFTLLFSSDRPNDSSRNAPPMLADAPPRYDIYRTQSREVFSEAVELQRPPIDWAAIWSAIGPNLLLALLALLLLLLILMLFMRGRFRRLSLIMKCLLGSLFLHLLLLLLFNFVEVTSSLMNALRNGEGLQVAIVSPVRADTITSQIRGSLTEVAQPAAAEAQMERTEVELTTETPTSVAELAVAEQPVRFDASSLLEATAADAPTPETEPRRQPVEASPVSEQTQNELTLNTPTDAQQMDTAESDARDRPAPMNAESVRENTSPPVEALVDATSVDLAPARSDALNEQPQTSMVSPNVVRDAAPAMPTAIASTSIPPSPIPTTQPVSDLSLPEAAGQEASAEAESQARSVEAVASRASRADRAVEPLPTETTGEQTRIEPAMSVSELADNTSMAAADAVREASAGPVKPARNPTATPADANLLPTPSLAVGLPADDAPQSLSKTGEPSPQRVASADGRRLRASTDALTPSVSTDVPMAELAPTPSAGGAVASEDAASQQFADASMAAQPADSLASPAKHSETVGEIAPALSGAAHPIEINLPGEVAPPEDWFEQRAEAQRAERLRAMGGSEESETAVKLALDWLARHQSPDGHWDGDGFDAGCGECGGETIFDVDVGLTGLALMCFLGADHTHAADGPYQDTVGRGLAWLVRNQTDEGDLRGVETMYSQGIATIALSEAYAMTKDRRLRRPVQRAIQFIERARNAEVGGWRYEPGQVGDTSVLGWQVMALKSASMAGIKVSPNSFAAAKQWMDLVSDPDEPGRYKYQPDRPVSRPMTAEGMFVNQLLSVPRDDPRMAASESYIMELPPAWGERTNTYYWYYATLALFHHQGESWTSWNASLKDALLPAQRREGKAAGSWDPVGRWAVTGGRVYQTAVCTLMLEVYYRYLPLHTFQERDNAIDAFGRIEGRVTDAATGEPIGGASVRLDVVGENPLVTLSRDDGSFVLYTPELPDFIAMSATRKGYVPESVNVPTEDLGRETLEVDIALRPDTEEVVVVEDDPEVHHLGNDRFEGRINSQFQKESEGDRFEATFEVESATIDLNARKAAVLLMAKGVQCPHRVFINGREIDDRLDLAPNDGSFGEIAISFDPSLLRAGKNEIEIRAVSCRGDLDDFEFVNLRIRVRP